MLSNSRVAEDGPKKVTQNPTTTGTSVLALKFNGGIVFAADTLGSYGSLARFRDCPRLMKVNDSTMIGCMGDYADFQYVKGIVEQLAIDDICKDDKITMTPRSLHSWLTRVLYNKRSRFDPLWTNFVVGGIEPDGKGFLGFVDKLGMAYQDPVIATGYGAYIAAPLMRSAWREDLTQEEAVKVIKDCMKVLYYRDARSYDKYQIGVVTSTGARIEDLVQIEPDWSVAHLITGYE
jgi:20S proteasome subunit beta 7